MATTSFDADRIGGTSAIDALQELVVQAGGVALQHFTGDVDVEEKPDRSPVTIADREVEHLIREGVLARYPEAEFFGEEGGTLGSNPALRFIVDPIDGTRAFVRGLTTWSILLGLEVNGVPVLGIAYMPAEEDLFVAVLGGGATHNGQPVHVSKVARLGDALVSHGSLQQFTEGGMGDALQRISEASDSARGFHDFDGYRQVLLGHADAMVDPGVKPYDICAPAVLVREAGGRFTSMAGDETIYGGAGVASNGLIHDALVEMLGA